MVSDLASLSDGTKPQSSLKERRPLLVLPSASASALSSSSRERAHFSLWHKGRPFAEPKTDPSRRRAVVGSAEIHDPSRLLDLMEMYNEKIKITEKSAETYFCLCFGRGVLRQKKTEYMAPTGPPASVRAPGYFDKPN